MPGLTPVFLLVPKPGLECVELAFSEHVDIPVFPFNSNM